MHVINNPCLNLNQMVVNEIPGATSEVNLEDK